MKPSRYYHHHDYNKNKCRFNVEEEKKKKKKSDRRKADSTADDALNCFPGFFPPLLSNLSTLEF
jgi:hypothetical protein